MKFLLLALALALIPGTLWAQCPNCPGGICPRPGQAVRPLPVGPRLSPWPTTQPPRVRVTEFIEVDGRVYEITGWQNARPIRGAEVDPRTFQRK